MALILQKLEVTQLATRKLPIKQLKLNCNLIKTPVGCVNPLSAKLTKWPNTLKQFVGQNLLQAYSISYSKNSEDTREKLNTRFQC